MPLKYRKNLIIIFTAIFLAVGFSVANSVSAQAVNPVNLSSISGLFGTATLGEIIGRLLQIFFGLLGVIAVLLIMYAGFQWMTAQGDPDKVTKAKRTLYNAIIGLVIIASAFAITTFLMAWFNPQGQPCTANDSRSCSVGGCSGTQVCSDDRSWGSCDIGSCVPNEFDWDTNKKKVTICEFSDEKFPNWPEQDRIRNCSTGFYFARLPKSNTLKVKVYSYNSEEAVSDLALFEVVGGNENQIGSTVAVTSQQETINGAIYNTASNLFNWDTVQETYKNVNSTIIKGYANDKSYYSTKVRVKFVPDHCLNNIKDADEQGVNCGPSCGVSCPGFPCTLPDNPVCADENCTTYCGNGCRCAGDPVIFWVDPSYDTNADSNLADSNTLDDDIGYGAADNYLTIYGRNFGSQGEVRLQSKSSRSYVVAKLADCANAWQDQKIIITIPADLTLTDGNLANYSITVVNSTRADKPATSNAWDFIANNVKLPGLCSVSPSKGLFPDKVNLIGRGFIADNIRDSKVVWYVRDASVNYWSLVGVTSTAATAWANTSVEDTVLENKRGHAAIKVYNNGYSNSVLFNIGNGSEGDPCGSGIGNDALACSASSADCQSSLICQGCSTDPASPVYQAGCDVSKNCTCRKSVEQECTPNEVTGCDLGGCTGKKTCKADGTWDVCVKDNPACVPYLGKTQTSLSLYTWGFLVSVIPSPGRRCLNDLWNDGTCDSKACGTALGCDTSAMDEEWLELYNPTASDISLDGWGVVYSAKEMSAEELANDKGLRPFNITSGNTLRAGGYFIVSTTTVGSANFKLFKNQGTIGLLDDKRNIIDVVTYNSSTVAFAPGSYGRKVDGLDSGTMKDFIYLSNSTPGQTNLVGQSSSTAHLVINEISLSHDACTCVPKAQLCTPNQVDLKTCPDIGNCKQQRVCLANGHWGACEIIPNQACYGAARSQASLSIYSWAFLATRIQSGKDFYVEVDCSRSQTCKDEEKLPSPTPWSNHWTDAMPGVDNADACLNSAISARFNKPMNEASLYGNLKFYVKINGVWRKHDVGESNISTYLSQGEGGLKDYFEIQGEWPSDVDFKIILTKGLTSYDGFPLYVDNAVLTAEGCNNTADFPEDAANAAFCWGFHTRANDDPNKYCKVGCIHCSPQKFVSRYYNAEQAHKSDAMSDDNVCIILNADNYRWSWSEQEQTQGPAYEHFWNNPIENYSIIGAQNLSRATSIAQKESNWRQYKDALFKDTNEPDADFGFFRIRAIESASSNSGSCPGHNNFTDPIVMENPTCSFDADGQAVVLQSPSPFRNTVEACTNASLFALFSRNMVNTKLIDNNADGTINGPIGNRKHNFIVQKCVNSSVENGAASTDLRPSGCSTLDIKSWIFDELSYTHSGMTWPEILSAPAEQYDSLTPEGMRLSPPGDLDANSYYRVIILGNNSGVRGAKTTAADRVTELEEGVLQTPSIGDNYFGTTGSGGNDYFWYFKTGGAKCPIDRVAVLPQRKLMKYTDESQVYIADPQHECQHLNPYSYTWDWSSLMGLNDENSSNNCQAATGEIIAKICNSNSKSISDCSVATPAVTPTTPTVKVFGVNEGQTNIKARAVNSRPSTAGTDCSQDKWGYGQLQIGYGGFKVIKTGNDTCLNTQIKFNFSADAITTSLRADENILLYKCLASDPACSIEGRESVDINLIYPFKNLSTGIWEPIFTNQVIVQPVGLLDTTTPYRVVVKGGPSGPLSFANSQLGGLNYSSNANKGSEQCDPTVYPFRAGDPYGDNWCNSGTCKFAAGKNLCGTPLAQCAAQDANLVAYYKFAKNNPLADSSGNNFTLRNIGNVSFIDSPFGQAGQFVGARGQTALENNSADFITKLQNADSMPLTVSAWVRLDNGIGAPVNGKDQRGNGIIASTYQWENINTFWGWTLGDDWGCDNGGSVACPAPDEIFFQISDGTNKRIAASYKGFYSDFGKKWTLVTGVFNPGKDVKLYINGKEVATTATDINSVNYYTGTPLRIGHRADYIDQGQWDGAISEVKIFNRALSAGEVASLAQQKDYCSKDCRDLGNINVASCGNSMIEPGEDCDDGNNINNDGCSNVCKWEGSNSRWGSRCNNDRVEKGEQCDFGSQAKNQQYGCDSVTCLWNNDYIIKTGLTSVATTTIEDRYAVKRVCEAGTAGCDSNYLNIGSAPSAPICGNSKIETGEECDDGAGNGAGKRCLANCLLGAVSSTCGNNKLDSGTLDSYSWTFQLDSKAQYCDPLPIVLTPCLNGIWQFRPTSDVTSFTVNLYEGSAFSENETCVADKSVGFWKRTFRQMLVIVERMIGLKAAVAANYWCRISTKDFSAEAVRMMRAGNYQTTAVITSISNANGEGDGDGEIAVIGYPTENNGYEVNYINPNNWQANTEYRAIVDYQRGTVPGQATQKINTYAAPCQIEKVNVNVWPKGGVKSADAFLCYSDPTRGIPDDCGRYTDDAYDDDMSTNWTKDSSQSGYDLDENGAPVIGSGQKYKPGNQHLYRAFARDSHNYPLRASFSWSLVNIDTVLKREEIPYTTNNFDSWVSSGEKAGKGILSIAASDASNANGGIDVGTATGVVNIWNVKCSNPWPTPRYMPFVDTDQNCQGSGTCINTNFVTWYCRDQGVANTCVLGSNLGKECKTNTDCGKRQDDSIIEGSCRLYTNDDLPSIGDFEYSTVNLGAGRTVDVIKPTTAVVKGVQDNTCRNLPTTFAPKFGYYNYSDSKLYLWSASAEVYAREYMEEGESWQRIDKGAWQSQGLPANFKPIMGYYYNAGVDCQPPEIQLWDASGKYLVYKNNKWVDGSKYVSEKVNLPSSFHPIAGYTYTLGDKTYIEVMDADGNYATWDPGRCGSEDRPRWSAVAKKDTRGLPSDLKLLTAYNDANNIHLWSVRGDHYSANASSFTAGTTAVTGSFSKDDTAKTGLPTGFKPTVSYYDPAFIRSAGVDNPAEVISNGLFYYYNSGGWEKFALQEKDCDARVKEFLFTRSTVISSESQISIPAKDVIQTDFDSACTPAGETQPQAYCPPQVWADGSVVQKNANYPGLKFNFNITTPGKYYIYLETSNETALPVPRSHRVELTVNAKDTATRDITASAPTNPQSTSFGLYQLNAGPNQLKVHWLNDDSNSAEGWDSNFRLYNVKLIKSDSADLIDAVGVRVYDNNSHYSPLLWYTNRFGGKNASPQSLLVDGYQALQDGRTVYVAAADLNNDASSVYSNIFLMSYNLNANESTVKIFNQMVANWEFNYGDNIQSRVVDNPQSGGLYYTDAVGLCSDATTTSQDYCLTDISCLKRGLGYCLSDKAKLTRDTKRLADVQDFNIKLNNYYNKTRCSNDQTKTCKTTADCKGSGVCGNYYPTLTAGTYITGKTFSTWPSWQQTLGAALGSNLPVDPINKFFGCASPYSATTCWDDLSKTMSCNISDTSAVYTYVVATSGTSIMVSAKQEYKHDIVDWQPSWRLVPGLMYYQGASGLRQNPFDAYLSYIAGGACTALLPTCGNGQYDAGETCSNCYIDNACPINQSCQKSGEVWSCKDITSCGNGVKEPKEQCDNKDENGNPVTGCSSICKCELGYDCSGATPKPVCGDGLIIAGVETCEFNPSTSKAYCEEQGGGAGCCCRYPTDYGCADNAPCTKNTEWGDIARCGNGHMEPVNNEICDCGDDSYSDVARPPFNPFECVVKNNGAANLYNNTRKGDSYQICGNNCQSITTSKFTYCGDGIQNNSETCEDTWTCCNKDCQWINGTTDDDDPGAVKVCHGAGTPECNDGYTWDDTSKRCICNVGSGYSCSQGQVVCDYKRNYVKYGNNCLCREGYATSTPGGDCNLISNGISCPVYQGVNLVAYNGVCYSCDTYCQASVNVKWEPYTDWLPSPVCGLTNPRTNPELCVDGTDRNYWSCQPETCLAYPNCKAEQIPNLHYCGDGQKDPDYETAAINYQDAAGYDPKKILCVDYANNVKDENYLSNYIYNKWVVHLLPYKENACDINDMNASAVDDFIPPGNENIGQGTYKVYTPSNDRNSNWFVTLKRGSVACFVSYPSKDDFTIDDDRKPYKVKLARSPGADRLLATGGYYSDDGTNQFSCADNGSSLSQSFIEFFLYDKDCKLIGETTSGNTLTSNLKYRQPFKMRSIRANSSSGPVEDRWIALNGSQELTVTAEGASNLDGQSGLYIGQLTALTNDQTKANHLTNCDKAQLFELRNIRGDIW